MQNHGNTCDEMYSLMLEKNIDSIAERGAKIFLRSRGLFWDTLASCMLWEILHAACEDFSTCSVLRSTHETSVSLCLF